MDKSFIPKKIVEDNIEYVLFNNMFRAEETIDYAATHNFNIKFICTTYTCACEVLWKIQSKGYELRFEEIKEHTGFYNLESTSIVVYCIL